MYAVIKTGGKQYKVAADDLVRIEKIAGEIGDAVSFENVLMVGNGKDITIGAPLVDGAAVAGEVVEQFRDDKVIVFKKKRRQGYRRTNGHRQHLTLVRITEILTGGAKPSAKKAAAPKKAAKAEPAKTETAKAEADNAKTPAKKPAAKTTEEAATKASETKPAVKKAPAKKPAAKKAEAKAADGETSAPAKKTSAQKTPAKKAPAKKAAGKADKE